MTGEMIGNLLRPLIGKSGTIFMVVSKSGQIGFTTDHNKKLTGVKVQEDGMVRLEREAGWAVITGVVIRLLWSRMGGTGQRSTMEVFAAGVIAGDALFSFYDMGSKYAALKK